jgi:hypothetical protein
MTKRREFMRKSLLSTAGLTLGSFALKSGSIFSLIENFGRAASNKDLKPVVDAEEVVYQYLPADNGAGPMWCSGSTSIVRTGKEVFASGIETVPDWKPLNNFRWILFERSEKGWVKKIIDKEGRTRELSPMVTFYDGRFFLSANPTLTTADKYDGTARFHITPDNPLLVIYFLKGKDTSGDPVAANRLVEIMSGGTQGTHITLPLKHPFSSFFTATVRAGSKPSSTIDILGVPDGVKNTISYARVRLQ